MTVVTITDPLLRALEVTGLAVVAFAFAVATAFVYRWYLRERVSTGLALLVGLAVVALYLNVKSVLGDVVAGETTALSLAAVTYNGAAFAAAALLIPLGVRIGDRLYRSTAAVTGASAIDGEVSRFVRTVGRLVAVELPTDIDDIPGYDPVTDDVKQSLAGTTLLFPRGLGLAELRDRLEHRLTDDYDIGTVDVDLEPDGTVSYLAVGRHPAGLGPTLGPGMAAVAIVADPPNAANPGDVVQVWTRPPDPTRITTAEVRATVDDVVTLALDHHDATTIAGGEYRLLTLPTTSRPDREFNRLLRAADATLAAITIGENSPLAATTVGAIRPAVVAVRPPARGPPSTSSQVVAGDSHPVTRCTSSRDRMSSAASPPRRPPSGRSAHRGVSPHPGYGMAAVRRPGRTGWHASGDRRPRAGRDRRRCPGGVVRDPPGTQRPGARERPRRRPPHHPPRRVATRRRRTRGTRRRGRGTRRVPAGQRRVTRHSQTGAVRSR